MRGWLYKTTRSVLLKEVSKYPLKTVLLKVDCEGFLIGCFLFVQHPAVPLFAPLFTLRSVDARRPNGENDSSVFPG